MKTSIRSTKFTLGIALFLIIILLLSILSAFYLYKLSEKTNAILKENHYSVVFAREMAENLTMINQEIANCLLTNNDPDTLNIIGQFKQFAKSLQLEKNNITEIGEGALVADMETNFNQYRDVVSGFLKSRTSAGIAIYQQKKFGILYKQLMLLSRMNENAIERKTGEAKVTAKNASTQMSLIGSLSFLIAFGFTFSFASYFNDRFYQLYYGMKDMVASNYSQMLNFKGNDEFYEISLIYNEMAKKLCESNMKNPLPLLEGLENDQKLYDMQELKKILIQMKNIEEQANELISKFEKNNK